MGANPKMPRRQLLQRLFNVGGGAAAGALSYAHFVEPSLLSITRQTLPMRHLSPSLKAAQLTDLHFRLGSDDALLAETVVLTGSASVMSVSAATEFPMVNAPSGISTMPAGGAETIALAGIFVSPEPSPLKAVAVTVPAEMSTPGCKLLATIA